MNIALSILIILFVISGLGLIYTYIQILRTNAAEVIILSWLNTNDKRYQRYSFHDILKPNRQNWWGLKIPKNKNFK